MNKNNTIPRLLSLDVFRGITIALMILVNSPGNHSAYSWLSHSLWNGCSLADLVFPFFVVIVGVSSVLALTNLQRAGASKGRLILLISRRSLYLFGIGLLLNLLPNHFDLSHLRFLGVLQRIAICYFVASMLFLTTSRRLQAGIMIALLAGYWWLLCGFSTAYVLTINDNLAGYVDQLILSPQHLYLPWFDPEGLLSSLPAIASALFGNVLAMLLLSSRSKEQQLRIIIAVGLGLLGLGLVWGAVFPINKSLWTSSYVLWTSGLAYLVFACCFALVDIKGQVYWSKPFSLFGKNALFVYVLHVFFLKVQGIIMLHNSNGELLNLRLYLTEVLFGHLSEKNASLCYAVSYTLFWLLVAKSLTLWRLRHAPKHLLPTA